MLVESGRDNDATTGTLAARSGVSARRVAGIIDDLRAVVLLSLAVSVVDGEGAPAASRRTDPTRASLKVVR